MQSVMETDAGDQGVAAAAHEAAAALPNDTAAVRRCLSAACALMSPLHVVPVLSGFFTAWPEGLLLEHVRGFRGAERFCFLYRRLRKPAKQRRTGTGLGGLIGRWRSG